MNKSTNQRTNEIDIELKKLKKESLFQNFTKKWSNHTIFNEKCNQTTTFDGNWKCWRAKCAFDGLAKKTTEFGDIATGCTNSPSRNSYYCLEHIGNEMSFRIGEKTMKI